MSAVSRNNGQITDLPALPSSSPNTQQASSSTSLHINDLPLEILEYIFFQAGLGSLPTYSLVCRKWLAITNDESFRMNLYKNFIKNKIGFFPKEAEQTPALFCLRASEGIRNLQTGSFRYTKKEVDSVPIGNSRFWYCYYDSESTVVVHVKGEQNSWIIDRSNKILLKKLGSIQKLASEGLNLLALGGWGQEENMKKLGEIIQAICELPVPSLPNLADAVAALSLSDYEYALKCFKEVVKLANEWEERYKPIQTANFFVENDFYLIFSFVSGLVEVWDVKKRTVITTFFFENQIGQVVLIEKRLCILSGTTLFICDIESGKSQLIEGISCFTPFLEKSLLTLSEGVLVSYKLEGGFFIKNVTYNLPQSTHSTEPLLDCAYTPLLSGVAVVSKPDTGFRLTIYTLQKGNLTFLYSIKHASNYQAMRWRQHFLFITTDTGLLMWQRDKYDRRKHHVHFLAPPSIQTNFQARHLVFEKFNLHFRTSKSIDSDGKQIYIGESVDFLVTFKEIAQELLLSYRNETLNPDFLEARFKQLHPDYQEGIRSFLPIVDSKLEPTQEGWKKASSAQKASAIEFYLESLSKSLPKPIGKASGDGTESS
jgi:hypothetical protein